MPASFRLGFIWIILNWYILLTMKRDSFTCVTWYLSYNVVLSFFQTDDNKTIVIINKRKPILTRNINKLLYGEKLLFLSINICICQFTYPPGSTPGGLCKSRFTSKLHRPLETLQWLPKKGARINQLNIGVTRFKFARHWRLHAM